MRRPLALALLLLLGLPALAQAGSGRFFAAEPVDEALSDVQRVEDVDVARDGHGAIVYLRRDAGEPHVFVSRLVDGALQPPERVDVGIPGPATQASVAVSDGGRMVIAFVTGGAVHSVVRPAGGGPLPAQTLAFTGSDPSVSMSVGGHAYIVFRSAGDLRAVRMERRETAFTALPDALDIEGPRDAGANGRPRVSTSADGTAIAVWGEGGAVYARRLFGLNVSKAPQLLAVPADSPDVGIEDDSSYAWAVYRTPGGTFARRQRGSAFDDPVRIDAEGDPGLVPRVAVSGRGDGYAGSTGSRSGVVFASVLKDDTFFPALAVGSSFGGQGLPVTTVAENGDGTVAYFSDGVVRARHYDNNPRSRVATKPAPEVTLSDTARGIADPAAGLESAGNRAGDALIAWTQVDGAGNRRLVASVFDRFPGAFRGTSSTKWRRSVQPELRWRTSFELWGPITYRLEIDGQPAGETTANGLAPSTPLEDGLHRWRVIAVDRRGQTRSARSRNLRIDGTKPELEVKVKRKKGVATVTAEVSDDPGTGKRASGVRYVRFQVGSGRRVTIVKPPFRVRRRAKGKIRVSVTDRAGNATVETVKLGK